MEEINEYISSREFKELPEIISLPQYLQRFPSGDSIDSLSKLLNLPNHPQMQDWEYEVADAARIDEFMKAYLNGELNDDEKFTLMETIIQSFSESNERLDNSKRWRKLLQIITENVGLHISTIHYWSLVNYQEIEEHEAETIEDYEIHIYFRALWEKYKDDFIDKEKDEKIRLYKLSLNYQDIKRQLNELINDGVESSKLNYFNTHNYSSFHNSRELKENFIAEIQSEISTDYKSNVWTWGKNKYKIESDVYFNNIKTFSKKTEELLGIPQSIVTLFEEMFSLFKNEYGERIAMKKINALYQTIEPGKDLSLFTPKYQYWLIQDFLLPQLEKINYPEEIVEIKEYAKITSELLQNYILGRFDTAEDIFKIVNLIRDWGDLIDEKKIALSDEFDSTTSRVVSSSLSLINNLSLFLKYGVNAADWAIRIAPPRSDLNKSKLFLKIIYSKIIQLLQE